MPNMIFYLMDCYHMEMASASILLNLWSAMSNSLAIVGAFLADSYLGRFSVIVLGSISSLLGMTLLWLTSMVPQLRPQQLCDTTTSGCSHSPTPTQLAMLFSCFGLISIGAGCIRPCSIAFGADQLDRKENPNNERVLQRFINWYYASTGLSSIIALTVIVSIQELWGWQVFFGVPAVLMVFSALMFLLGSSLYVKVKGSRSLFTGFFQVVVAAMKNRRISLPLGYLDDFYHKGRESKFSAPTEDLRCLNKACIVTNPEGDINPDGSASNPWRLCTVEQVESLKALLRSIPMWSAGIMILVSIIQSSNSFATIQAKTMDRRVALGIKIPAGSFAVFTVVVITIWVAFYDRIMILLVEKFTGKKGGLSPKLRMGIGLLLSCIAMAVSAMVETRRRTLANEEGFVEDAKAVVDMSAFWLVPQYALLGLAEAFFSIGQMEFFFTQFPKSMSSIAMALSSLGMAVASLVGSFLVNFVTKATTKVGGESWLSNNLNKGHLDYFYWLITFLGSLNLVYYLICCRAFYESPIEKETTRVSAGEEEDVEEPAYKELPSA